MTNSEVLWTKKDVARYLRVSTRTVDKYISEYGMPCERPPADNHHLRFRKESIDAWLQPANTNEKSRNKAKR